MLCRVAAYSGPGFPRPATNRIGFSSTVAKSKIQKLILSEAEPNGSKIENGLLLLLFFLWTWRGGSSLALFLLLGGNFRSHNSSFGRSDHGLFFDNGGEYGEHRQVGWHLCCHS